MTSRFSFRFLPLHVHPPPGLGSRPVRQHVGHKQHQEKVIASPRTLMNLPTNSPTTPLTAHTHPAAACAVLRSAALCCAVPPSAVLCCVLLPVPGSTSASLQVDWAGIHTFRQTATPPKPQDACIEAAYYSSLPFSAFFLEGKLLETDISLVTKARRLATCPAFVPVLPVTRPQALLPLRPLSLSLPSQLFSLRA